MLRHWKPDSELEYYFIWVVSYPCIDWSIILLFAIIATPTVSKGGSWYKGIAGKWTVIVSLKHAEADQDGGLFSLTCFGLKHLSAMTKLQSFRPPLHLPPHRRFDWGDHSVLYVIAAIWLNSTLSSHLFNVNILKYTIT